MEPDRPHCLTVVLNRIANRLRHHVRTRGRDNFIEVSQRAAVLRKTPPQVVIKRIPQCIVQPPDGLPGFAAHDGCGLRNKTAPGKPRPTPRFGAVRLEGAVACVDDHRTAVHGWNRRLRVERGDEPCEPVRHVSVIRVQPCNIRRSSACNPFIDRLRLPTVRVTPPIGQLVVPALKDLARVVSRPRIKNDHFDRDILRENRNEGSLQELPMIERWNGNRTARGRSWPPGRELFHRDTLIVRSVKMTRARTQAKATIIAKSDCPPGLQTQVIVNGDTGAPHSLHPQPDRPRNAHPTLRRKTGLATIASTRNCERCARRASSRRPHRSHCKMDILIGRTTDHPTPIRTSNVTPRPAGGQPRKDMLCASRPHNGKWLLHHHWLPPTS